MNRLILLTLTIALAAVAASAGPIIITNKPVKKPIKTEKAAEKSKPIIVEAIPVNVAAKLSSPIDDALEEAAARHKKEKEDAILRLITGDDPVPEPNPPPQPQPTPPTPPVPAPDNEDPYIELPPEIEADVGDLVEIIAKTNCKKVTFLLIDKGVKKVPEKRLASQTMAIVYSTKAGEYRIAAFGSRSDTVVTAETVLLLHGAQPPPGPIPGPIPPPDPPTPTPVNPTAARLWITIVENAVKRTPESAAILTDINLRRQIEAMGHKFEIINTTDQRAQLFKTQVDTLGGVPCVTIMDTTKNKGNWLNQTKSDMQLPDSSAGLLTLVQRYTAR